MRLSPASVLVFGLALSLSACAGYRPERSIARGRFLAQANCASCHAIGPEGGSPNPFAPEFRNLRKSRSLVDIERTFNGGHIGGHPPMPSFVGFRDDPRALLDYIQSVQDPPVQFWPRRVWK